MRGSSSIPKTRVITSCSNCHRRKQKCDRRRPCGHCNARKIGHECLYDLASSKGTRQTNRSSVDQSVEAAESVGHTSHSNQATRDLLGYSATRESNAFIEADQALHQSGAQQRSTALLDFDPPVWQNYWQVISLLPSEAVSDDLIAVHFLEINWINGLVEDYPFLLHLNEWRSFTHKPLELIQIGPLSVQLGCFPAILFQLLAITIQFLPPEVIIEGLPQKDRMVLSQKYSDAGVRLIQLIGNQGFQITAVQHDLLRAAWLKNRGRGAEAWHALSDSIRKAQELNLHRYEPLQNPSSDLFWHFEWRKKIWITLFVWDSNMSMLLGRPRLLNAADCDTELPLLSEIPATMRSRHLISALGRYSESDNICSPICVSLLMYSFSQIVHEIRNLGADKRGFKDYSVVQGLESRILTLMGNLPIPLRSPNPDTSSDLKFPILPRQREKVYTVSSSLIMALHRPHVRSHEHSRNMVVQAAFSVLDSQQRFFEVINRFHYAYFGNAFFSIDAMIVLSTAVTEFPIKDLILLQRIIVAAQQAIGRMCLIECGNKLAFTGVKILRSCHQIVKDAYNRIKYLDAESIRATRNSAGDGDIRSSHDNQVTASFGHGIDTDLMTPEQANSHFADYLAHVEQAVENDFDISYWMTYRQQVADDAAYRPETDGSWSLY